jgi:hypothetical protein
MKRVLAMIVIGTVAATGLMAAESDTATEVKDTITANFRYTNEHQAGVPESSSKDGTVEFWSSGGLMNWSAGDDPPGEWDHVNLTPKHIKVIPLVEGQAAVAMYYSEGSMKPKGSEAVSHYMTRVTEVYVKEDGKWKVRAAHWSPVVGGSGTSQTTVD